jgi:hypothetical protein
LPSVNAHRTQSPDTSAVAERALFDEYRKMTPVQRITMVWDLNRAVESRARAAIRQRSPEASERDVELRLAARKYARELMLRVFGWDPQVRGW